ncbi:MAG TPA: RNA methyltransferase [Thermomicrobiales bacterium]|nr:RNA methyltransferase [Thermomicrobiales bacterium]
MNDPRFTGDVIASPANKGIKTIRSLQRRKGRQQERAFVVEGTRAVEDILQAAIRPRAIYVRDDFPLTDVPDVQMPVHRVARNIFDTLTDVPHPQGILAIVPTLPEREVPVPDERGAPLILIIDGVRDPGNMGTLFRSAAGAGIDHIVIGPESVDAYHPKAVRAAMGAHVRIPFSHRDWPSLAETLATYDLVALADASGEAVYDEVDWTASAALIVGSEAFGPSSGAWQLANTHVSIPLSRGVESLNAGVAGSLLLFEAVRQRRGAAGQSRS